MERGKVFLYTHGMTGGGAERVWALLASGLARRGHDVTLITDFAAEQNESYVDPSVRRVTLGGRHVVNVVRLARLLARERPDVSMSALSVSNIKHFAAACLAGALPRAVLSFHGYSETEPQFLSRLGYIATAAITRATAASVCVSEGVQRYVIERWHGDARKTRRIYNPVDPGPRAAAASEAELLARGPVVLAAGRLVDYKGFRRLVRAFAKVEPASARLVILGEGAERAAIEADIARLGLGERVTLAGYVREPWDDYRQAACFALASDSEPFGLVVVEALGNGLAVVATDCEGPREILADGRFGALVARGDEDALAAALSRALASPGDPAPRVERARAFSLDRGLDEYEALIADVMEASRRSPSTPVGAPKQAKKILLYTHALAGGGAERAMALLASGLARRGDRVTFVSDYESRHNSRYLDAKVRRVQLGSGHSLGVLRLARLLAKEKPDVSMSALGASNLKHAAAALLAGRRRRAVLSYHGFFRSEPRPLSRLSFVLTPALSRLTAGTVAVSAALRENLVRRWRANPRRTHYIQNPVFWGETPERPTREALQRRDKMVLACGRLSPDKNFLGLVRAFARLPRPDARLTIIGDGEERAAIEAEAVRLGVADRLEMPGYVTEPWSYFDRASCLAVNSYSESFGMVIVEALAHGLPVVATDCGGPREILGESGLGRLVPVADDAALAAAIDAALADPGDPAPRVRRASAFSQEASVASYASLFEDVSRRAAVPGGARALAIRLLGAAI